jgi:hypothetical protein
MTEIDHLFVFMCGKNKGWGSFNWMMYFMKVLFIFMCGRKERLDNFTFIKRENKYQCLILVLNMFHFV